jgi:hypothetical protein
MRSLINNILIIIFILTSFTFCTKEEGLPKKKLAHMYVDILIADQTYQFNLDSLNIAVQNVYEKHGISKSIYDDEVSRLSADEETWNEFFDMAQTYLDSLKTEGSDPDF